MRYTHYTLTLAVLAAFLAASVTLAQTPKGSILSFTAPATKASDAQAFQAFIDKHRGQLVHLNVQMNPRFSRIGDKIQGKQIVWDDDLFVATSPCDAPQPVLNCAGAHFLLAGKKDYTLEYYQGGNRLDGYFTINDNTENHQGIYFMLRSVPAAQVLLHK